MNPHPPQFPIYIVSKGRAKTRHTAKALEKIGLPYRIIVEEQERDQYATVIDPAKILVLDKKYQRDYDAFDDLGDTKGKGPGPARNFAWDHSIAGGHAWHWVMDDNILMFYRLDRNVYGQVLDGTIFRCMEDFALRYQNMAMAGPNYFMFAPRKQKMDAFRLNTRIYSCNLIRNDVPFRWRGRYNEDTDLSVRMMKAGWCTVQFNAFLQHKQVTQRVAGGNTAEFYAKEGTLPKSRMLVEMHPDVTELTQKWGRWHHHIDYVKHFGSNALIRKPGVVIPKGANNYDMVVVPTKRTVAAPWSKKSTEPEPTKKPARAPRSPARSTSGSRPKDAGSTRTAPAREGRKPKTTAASGRKGPARSSLAK